MIYFNNDYSEGCHEKVLSRLVETNMAQSLGYGEDEYCAAAAAKIRAKCGREDVAVHFLVGGTQANLTVIDAALRPHQGALGPDTAHINVHETGAVEATGHKVLWVPHQDGKITAAQVAEAVRAHRTNGATEHTVQPKLVYISNPTELGTLYTLGELEELSQTCRELGLYLFLDGARLGSALTSPVNDLTLPDLAALTDVFYIGGTKNGALFGEALVVNGSVPRDHFRWFMKQRGAMLAKGRLLGVQFQALLEDGLYFDMARHANDTAFRLRDGIIALGYPFPVPSPSNQQFPVLPNTVMDQLREMGYEFEVDAPVDDTHTRIRLVTSWSTPEAAVEKFLADLALCH